MGIRSKVTLEACIAQRAAEYEAASKEDRASAEDILAACNEQPSCDYVHCARHARDDARRVGALAAAA